MPVRGNRSLTMTVIGKLAVGERLTVASRTSGGRSFRSAGDPVAGSIHVVAWPTWVTLAFETRATPPMTGVVLIRKATSSPAAVAFPSTRNAEYSPTPHAVLAA